MQFFTRKTSVNHLHNTHLNNNDHHFGDQNPVSVSRISWRLGIFGVWRAVIAAQNAVRLASYTIKRGTLGNQPSSWATKQPRSSVNAAKWAAAVDTLRELATVGVVGTGGMVGRWS